MTKPQPFNLRAIIEKAHKDVMKYPLWKSVYVLRLFELEDSPRVSKPKRKAGKRCQ